jgi:hypothetical protein
VTEEAFLVHMAGLIAAALILGLPPVLHGLRLLRRESTEGFQVGGDSPRFEFEPMPEPVSGPLTKLLLRWRYRSWKVESRRAPAEDDATS